MKTLAIIGAGHLGQQIAHYAITDGHFQKVVYFDDFENEKKVDGFDVLGKSDEVLQEFKKRTFDELIIGIGYKHLGVRKKMFNIYQNQVPLATIIHSSAWVDSSAHVEEGCIIYPRCEIDRNSVIKSNTILNLGCSIAHDTTIGAHSFLAPRVSVAGFVTIDEHCILGVNCTIVNNLNICDKTQIGAGAVLTRSIDRSGVYFGNPAKFIR